MGYGEELSLGAHVVRWIDTPHLPQGWVCSHLFEKTTRTLFRGDLFTQGGHEHEPLTTEDIFEASENMRGAMDYFSQTRNVNELMEKLAINSPRLLACMHGSAWKGDGAALLRQLAGRLGA
jgi:flavorubredoxin